MFILHSSNKTENLVAHLAAILTHAPLSDPFAKEVFLIQSQGMERWLSQQLASHFNVWANYQFLFPGKFFSTIAQQLDSKVNDTAFDRSLILWRIEALLRHLEGDIFGPLIHYLSGTNCALKRYQQAQQLAQLFDQYQVMRPDLLAVWQHGKFLYGSDIERWQQALWCQLTQAIGAQHRGALWLEVITKLKQAQANAFRAKLPERISIFGVNTMPPLFLEYLQNLANHCDVHLYLLNPASTYWADLTSKRQLNSEQTLNGHPLLVSMGKQGSEFQEMLQTIAQFDIEPESFELIDSANNLQQIQNDILNNALFGQPLTYDGSISIHACHSRKREVEVLRDQLLLALENDPSLELREIAVMAPDIQHYEVFISAVFDDIQHAIADRSLRLENELLDTFIRFLTLSQSRLGWQSVLDLLERQTVFSNFELSETDLELINYWVQSINVRWGQSGQHKVELGLPELNEHTWQAALDRLLMGYAVGNDNEFIDGVLPYAEIEGTSALALGGLNDFLTLLFQAKTELKQAKSLKAWGNQLYIYADQLFGKTDQNSDLLQREQLNTLLLELSNTLADVHQESVELQVIIQWLEGMVAERKSANGFLRGQLTFCSMLPMRTIPFKVIALLGINEGEFPKTDRNPTFDLIALNFRQGDRSRRADDRYQFLEILLSARQQLIVTYIGQSQANNEPIPPSVVITELLDVMRDYYHLPDPTLRHPLQAFSRQYFDGSRALFSFSEANCTIAKALMDNKPEPQLWWQGEINAPEAHSQSNTIIELADLLNYFQHPQRFFLRRQLGLHFKAIAAEVEEREPFSLEDLDVYGTSQTAIEQLINNNSLSLPKLQAKGSWLPSATGELAFESYQKELQTFVEAIKVIDIGKPLEAIPVDLSLGQYRIIGVLGNRYQNGSLLYRYAKLKGKDFINAWLHHLLINQIDQQVTHLVCTDSRFIFPTKLIDSTYLIQLLEIYLKGQQRPDVFFVEAALSYVQQAAKPQAKKLPLEAAKDSLRKQITLSYEAELGQLFGNVADMDLILPDNFATLCETLLLPAWEMAYVD